MREWREEARAAVERVLAEAHGGAERDIRAALRAAYPFGARRNFPYWVWRDEIALQRGLPRPRRPPIKYSF